MVSFHPDSKFLTDFAAGSLPLSEAVCVSAHLEFCGKCRAHVQQLSDVAAQMMERLEPIVDEIDGFESMMQRIDSSDSVAIVPASSAVAGKSALGASGLPRVVEKLAGGSLQNLNWVKLGSSLRIAPMKTGCKSRQTAIYDIKAGRPMPEHEHRGEEITVLLKGSFSDAEGKYVRGDFVVRHAGERHQPTATLDTDCICLVSLEQPVRTSSWWYRLMEPFVQYRLSGFSR